MWATNKIFFISIIFMLFMASSAYAAIGQCTLYQYRGFSSTDFLDINSAYNVQIEGSGLWMHFTADMLIGTRTECVNDTFTNGISWSDVSGVTTVRVLVTNTCEPPLIAVEFTDYQMVEPPVECPAENLIPNDDPPPVDPPPSTTDPTITNFFSLVYLSSLVGLFAMGYKSGLLS